MPWAQVPATRQSIGEFLDQAERDWERGREFQFAIRGRRGAEPEALVGFCGLHDRIGAGGLEIGYWVRSDCTGRGVATSAASALTASALGLDGVSRVEIHCDAANVRSAAIPPKLGFRLDRIEDPAADVARGDRPPHDLGVPRLGELRPQLIFSRSTTKTSVSLAAIPGPGELGPYPRLGGMISSRRPPTFMPTTPWSQPGMTCAGVASSVKVNGWLVHEDWITFSEE